MPDSTRPVIAINADFTPASKSTAAHARLNAGYFDTIYQAGGLPLVVPPLPADCPRDFIFERVDGFLLTGNPFRPVQADPSDDRVARTQKKTSPDSWITQLLGLRLPVLAVGPGMHQLNLVQGGSLYRDLREELPRSLPHRDPAWGTHRHMVLVEPRTRLAEMYGCGEIRVNSSHNQAVRQVGAGLRVAALAPDGVIEAIEGTDPDWFCVGVQWHPEAETASALDRQMFECFLEACAAFSQGLRPAA